MRQFFFFLITCLLSIPVFSQCIGDIHLETQAEVDGFMIDYGCSVIEGDLIIGTMNWTSNPDIFNLTGLSAITTIIGNLEILNNSVLNDLTPLSNLISISGDLVIDRNNSLTTLMGFESIIMLEGLLIKQNESLINLNGLSNLTAIEQSLVIHDNDSLIDLDGLSSLTTVGLDLRISSNNSLIHISDLSPIFVGQLLYVVSNPNLSACCSLQDIINTAQGTVTINSNFSGCNSVEDIAVNCVYSYSIEVKTFNDINQNNVFDSDEHYITQSFLVEPDPFFTYSSQYEGAKFLLTDFGEYTLSINYSNPLWTLNDGIVDSIEIAYFDENFSDTLHYFSMQPTGDFTIQDIDLSSSITRCNQNTNYWLTYTNTGTTINDGYIQLIPDEITNFISANPMPDSTAGDTLYWYYEDLFPTYSKQIHIVYEMPGVDELGQEINFEAEIQTWEGFGDDKAIYSSELICAYDPNDKQVFPTGYTDENYTLFGDTLEYMIRFQNTGNDTAFNVVIRDELDVSLDLNSFEFIASSHPCRPQLKLNERLAEFYFDDIYLPDSFVNEPASHGFVKFRIVGKNNLAEATVIENTAGIFFDSNPPIITNTVTNTMVSVIPDPPVLAVSPGFIDFGEMILDEAIYTPQYLTFTNAGDLNLEVRYRLFDSPNFGVDELEEWLVEPQTTADFSVYFNPETVGEFTDTLTLITNVGTLPIPVKGTALDPTGIPHLSNSDFQIYPNPNQGQFVLKTKNEMPFSYKIYNSLGQLIIEQKSANNNEVINLAEAGLYVVMVETEDGVWVDKVVVE